MAHSNPMFPLVSFTNSAASWGGRGNLSIASLPIGEHRHKASIFWPLVSNQTINPSANICK